MIVLHLAHLYSWHLVLFVNKVHTLDEIVKNIFHILLFSLNLGTDRQHNKIPMMMVVCIMLFFSTLIIESYKGNFISILLLKKVYPPFDNYYSLYHKTDYEVGYQPGTNIEEIFLVFIK